MARLNPPAEVLRRLELAVTRRLDGLLHGDFRGILPGQGAEPGEARPYLAGDDVRRLDWNVTARMAEPYVRDATADRELETWLVVDVSASMDFGTAACTKRELALAGAAAVGHLTARGGNRVGLVLVGARQPLVVPPRSGRQHLRGLLHRVITAAPAAPGAPAAAGGIAGALRGLSGPGRRRGLVVVVSDLLDGSGWERAVRAAAARHAVLAIEIVDPRELEIPPVGVLSLVDLETGARRELRTSRSLRERYAAAARAQRDGIADALRSAGADHLQLRTDRDWLGDLVAFVQLRRARVEHRRGRRS